MKGFLLILLGLLGCQKSEEHARAVMYKTDESQEQVGTVFFKDTQDGMEVVVNLQGIPEGTHGFHVHVNPDCGSAADDLGRWQPALKAGGHYDPSDTHKHLGPEGKGHLGDLPKLQASAAGKVDMCVYAPRLKVADIRGRSVIVHAGGDNYQDTPEPLGGGGVRIVCGVIE